MRFACALLIFLVLGGCAQVSVQSQQSLLDSVAADERYLFEPLPMGMQDDPNVEEHVIELPGGKSFYKGYSLAKGHPSINVQLRTFIEKSRQGDGFFYPVIEFLDFNLKQIEVIRPQLRFTQLSPDGRYAAIPLQVSRDVGYMVIRTEPKLYDQEASYTKQHQGASWSYSVTPFAKRLPASYLRLGSLELLTPDEGLNRPFEKLSGPFWQVAFQKGGASVASASDYIPDMTLGGGPSFSLGYSFAIPGRPSSSLRTSLGASYYTLNNSDGDFEQSGLSSDIIWVESNQVSSIGLGVTINAEHSLRQAGETTNYKTNWGPKVILEMRGAMGVSLGAHLSWLTFESDDGVETRSNQIGFYFIRLY
ncbi:MAG: hypothetical protein V7785_15450 [Bermanella sp.]